MDHFLMHLSKSRNLLLVVIVMAIIVLAEIFCRLVLGLGTPPLYIKDSKIEYLMKPDQHVIRFGNQVIVNHWGMRSPDFSQTKNKKNEFRVLIFGDSVINGGSETDQKSLATTLLQKRLQAALHSPVIVGNISAGSWGPGNWLAYSERYGFFDSDVIILIVGSGDIADNPTFEPLKSTHPTQKPILALQEALFRYLPRYLPSFSNPINQPKVAFSKEAISKGSTDMQLFLRLAKDEGRKVMIFHHPDKSELLTSKFIQGHDEIQVLASSLNIPFTDLSPQYSKIGLSIYRDDIHPNLNGQKVISDVLFDALMPTLAPYISHSNKAM